MPGPHSPNPGVGTNGPAPYPEPSSHEPQALDYPTTSAPPNRPSPGTGRRRGAAARRISRRAAAGVLPEATAQAAADRHCGSPRAGVGYDGGDHIRGPHQRSQHGRHILGGTGQNRDSGIPQRAGEPRCGHHRSQCAVRYPRRRARQAPDQALAKLSSDAFRKQFSQVEVTSIDKIVYWSQYQAQVLFTMQVTPAAGGPPRGQVQGIAQLLFQRGQVLVCSYVLRTAGSY